jgi:hypothetical protein
LGLLGIELTANRTGELPFRLEAKSSSTETIWVFEETDHTLQGAFLDYWRSNGGLRVFGFPISEPFTETGKQVQYFERARFELAPGTADQVMLGLLGYEYQVQATQKVHSLNRTFLDKF